jgi:hypothetical protein
MSTFSDPKLRSTPKYFRSVSRISAIHAANAPHVRGGWLGAVNRNRPCRFMLKDRY